MSTSHTTVRSNSARGPSNDARTRAATNSRTSSSAAGNSRYPQTDAYDPKLDVDFIPLREQDLTPAGLGQAAWTVR
ncbi:hypothetical protein [Streptomyces sp. NPDC060333]|uniref:hypothetical protein n=1 Tax=Streptomyces sp. NPDC060333 TaxID=3347098 RepID=UPI003666D0C4